MDTLQAKYGSATTRGDQSVASALHGYWANFVKTGNPNGRGLPQWPVYDAKADVIMQFHADGTNAAAPDPLKARLDAVAGTRKP
jgi:para-nitrobenzyl esterase